MLNNTPNPALILLERLTASYRSTCNPYEHFSALYRNYQSRPRTVS
ncbi:hypothetical protein [Cardiobacterium hominis]|nr:hypothetical protein [Cardiobacterium hominis]